MSDSLRDALTSAMDTLEAGSPAEVEAPAPEVEAVEAPPAHETEAPEATSAPTDETPAQAAQRARDEAGRFAKQGKTPPPPPKGVKALQAAQAAPKPAAPPVAPKPDAAAAQPEAPKPPDAAPERAPQAWKPAAREHWAKLPPEVRAEVDRREKEVARVLSESAPQRKLAESFMQTLAPYRPLLTGEPMQVVGGLLQTAAQLQTGTPQAKAQMAATIIKQYAIPIDLLDAALSGEGQPQAGQGAAPGQPMDAESLLAQAEARVMQRMQAERQRSMVQREAASVEAFAQKNEFFNDVRDTMRALIESGRAADLQDAYDKACWADPDVRAALLQRQQAQASQATLASAQRARAASSSVRTAPAVAPAQGVDVNDRRAAIEAAIAASTRR
jgi:hypothetical protein